MPSYSDLVDYFKVQYQIVGTTDDGADEDDLPDKTEISGWITFTANLKKGRGILFQTGAPPFELVPLRRRVRVENGKLSHNDTGYIKLEAASPNGNPSNWNWKVTFDLAAPSGKLDLAPFDIAAIPDSIVDLTTAAPVGGSSGTTIVRGATGTSVGEIILVNGDRFEFYGDDPDRTLLGSAIVPALTIGDETREAADEAIAASDAARASETAAAESAGAAGVSAGNASLSASAAAGSAGAAGASAGNASLSASAAAGSAGTAAIARDEAVDARNITVAARDVTTAARDITVTARNEAVTARDQAATARDETLGYVSELEDAALGVVPENSIAPGKLQDNAVTTPKIAPDAVTSGKLASSVRTSLGKADSAYQKPSSGIPAADLAEAARTSLGKADAALPAAEAPCDFVWVSHSGTRKTGVGDLAAGMYVGRPFRVDSVTYQFDTPDASGSTSVQITKNGTAVPGSTLTVTAANQADATGTDAPRTAALTDSARTFAAGTRFALNITGVGATPGKGCRVYVKGVWTGL